MVLGGLEVVGKFDWDRVGGLNTNNMYLAEGAKAAACRKDLARRLEVGRKR